MISIKQKVVVSVTMVVAAYVSWVNAAELNQVVPNKSTLSFISKQMNVPVDGSFKRFSAKIAFDPAKPQAAKAQFDVDMDSIDAGSNEANDEVKAKDWFNVKVFPKATFVSEKIKALGSNRYEVTGPLTIKGKTQQVTAPFTLSLQGKTGIFDGAFTLKRTDFGLGEGTWADVSVVANEVQMKFHIVAEAH